MGRVRQACIRHASDKVFKKNGLVRLGSETCVWEPVV